MRNGCLAVSALMVSAGCAGSRPDAASYMTSDSYRARPALTGSLFPGDEAVLGDKAIEKLLTSKIILPANLRLAVLRLRSDPNRGRFSRAPIPHQHALVDFIGALRACDRLSDASVLPSLLVPEKQTVPFLREAAARYQAQLLLLYRPAWTVFAKERVFGADEAKVWCRIEAVLLDVRTGTVPFTTTVSGDALAKKSKAELTFHETISKARDEAFSSALSRLASETIQFLEAAMSEGVSFSEPRPSGSGPRWAATPASSSLTRAGPRIPSRSPPDGNPFPCRHATQTAPGGTACGKVSGRGEREEILVPARDSTWKTCQGEGNEKRFSFQLATARGKRVRERGTRRDSRSSSRTLQETNVLRSCRGVL
ncbi:MAG: hypothetical protein ACE5F9_10085 [Phycisphaerae bacterium]